MSSMELPQVAGVSSVRSTSSRGSARSVGSSAPGSSRHNRSDHNQRGHRSPAANDNIESEGEYEYEDEEEEDGDGNDEEEPQESSGGLWDEVESFLNRPSPSLSVLAKPDKAKKHPASGSVLPTLKPDHSRRRGSAPENHHADDGAARTGTRPVGRQLYQPSSKAPAAPKVIDPKLLQEAFAYAHKVSLMDFQDDQQEQADVIHERHHPLARSSSRNFARSSSSSTSSSSSSLVGGGPRAPSSVGATTKKHSSSTGGGGAKSEEAASRKKVVSSSSKSSAYGSIAKPAKKKSERRMKESTQWDPSSVPSGGSGDSASNDLSCKHMDPQVMQSLVSNFQNGTTLDELRKELAASQQSMTLSRQVLHDAAKAFFQPAAH